MKTTVLLPDRKSTAWGFGYMLFEFLALPYLVFFLFGLLGLPLDAGWLNLLQYAVNFAVLAGIFWRFLCDSVRHAIKNISTVLLAALICYFAYQLSSTLVSIVTFAIYPDFSNVNDASISSMAVDNFGMWAFATVVLVPPAEELLFRGVLFGGLYPHSKVAAWVLSILGFALIHVVGYIGLYPLELLALCLLQYLPAGICLAAAYRFSGNILTPILIHAALNALAMLSMAAM